MSVSGAILREVGTTNITRFGGFRDAIGPNTAALMQIHTSNYRVSGFTKSVSTEDLVGLGKKHGIKVIDDIGSGAMLDFARFGFEGEPVAKRGFSREPTLFCSVAINFSEVRRRASWREKKEWIQKIEKDPLMRAFRCDKMTLAALEATLRLYLREEWAVTEVPVLYLFGPTIG